MLDRVLSYVRSVLSGEVKGDPAVGRYLMDTLGASTDDLEKGGFNASLQVRSTLCFMIFFGADCDPLGYANGIVPSKSRAIAGRGLVSTRVGHSIIVVHVYNWVAAFSC